MTSPQPIVVFGTGGLAKEVTWLLEDTEETSFSIEAYVDLNPVAPTFLGRPVVSEETYLRDLRIQCPEAILAIGDPTAKRHLATKLTGHGVVFPSITHRTASVNKTVTVGSGTVICRDVIFTRDISVGQQVYFNFRCSLAHDVTIGDYVVVNPHACVSGMVEIGDDCVIGAGSVIRQGIKIGEGSTVGLGAVVFSDVPPGVTVVGNPARPMWRKES
ncbi:MAG: hypothetical protein C1O27_002111 [Chloroflexi bacterium]|jgi:sugar O-acyltransferase (sialic acid O-acetyltransferase NeuD family)|nr:MAG: hypothetical protein C1O27_002111 [Chloroflexota bacterium]